MAALLLMTACARTIAVPLPQAGGIGPGVPSAPPVTVGSEETGLASWYGYPYHGRRTASGEVYDMNDMTAAHRTLPLGTRLMVTNLDTGQAVEVRVNDRGPFVDGRILDLSYAAARSVGADQLGVIPVRLRVLDGEVGPAPTGGASFPAARFAVQVGAFAERARAEGLRQSLARDGDAATISPVEVGGDTFFRVRLGPYADRPSAQAAARRLALHGYLVIVVEP